MIIPNALVRKVAYANGEGTHILFVRYYQRLDDTHRLPLHSHFPHQKVDVLCDPYYNLSHRHHEP